MTDIFPESREEEILVSTINGEEYDKAPESRIEALLLELKEVIEEGGGGGGGTSNYNLLTNKPSINSITLAGDKSLEDLGITAEIAKVAKMIAGYFDIETDYEAGDIVIYDKKLYQFVTDHDAGEWWPLETKEVTIAELLESSGGGDASLETAVTSNTTVGAITSGTTLPKGTSFTAFVQKLLVSEVAPTISFSISKSGNVEVGDSYTETLTLSVTNMGSAKKIKSIAWYEGNTLKQTDTIDSTTTGSWTYTMPTATTTNTTFKAIVTYTKSDDTDTSVTKTASINFYYKKFYGGVSELNPSEATVEALTGALATSKGGTYSFTVTAGRICYAYPKSLGALTSIKDGNGFSLFDSFTRTEVNYTQHGNTVAYYRYVLTDATTVSGYSVVFA